MDLPTFLSNIVGSLAWPAATIVLVLILRQPIVQLIPTIQKLKYKDLAIEFGRRVDEAADEAGDSLPPPQSPAALPPTRLAKYVGLAKASPRAAVLEAWLEVEAAIVGLARRRNLHLGEIPARSPSQALKAVEKARVLDELVTASIRDLRALRNEAVHYPEFAIGEDSALKYAQTALAIADVVTSTAQ